MRSVWLKRLVVVLSFSLLVATHCGLADSAVPYVSYVYDYWGRPIQAPQAYLPSEIIDGKRLGVGDLNKPADVVVANDGSVYVVDTGNNRIIHTDGDWSVINVISEFMNKGSVDHFKSPQGIAVAGDGHVFVADTDNGRIIELDQQGQFLREIGPPKSNVNGVIEDNFAYKPRKVGVDEFGRLFVIADSIYEGFIVLDAGGVFSGFMGAPRVAPSVADVFWHRFATREQRARQALFLPTEYGCMDMDDRGFIYAIKAGTIRDDSIRKLSPAGMDVLGATFFPALSKQVFDKKSNFVDIVARQYGIFSVLSSTGRVSTYDSFGRLLYVFGANGNIVGTFDTPVALDTMGDQVVVLDAALKRITVFRPSEYARLIHSAIALYDRGHYDEATRVWRDVLSRNANYDIAYSEIGRALLRQGKYSEAMAYFRLGNDRSNYSDAFRMHRRYLIETNFSLFMSLLVGFVLLVWLLQAWKRRRGGQSLWLMISGKVASSSVARTISETKVWGEAVEVARSLSYSLYLVSHPFEGFWQLKRERKGDMRAAVIILAALTLTYTFFRQYTGFIFNDRDIKRISLLTQAFTILVPVVLWCAINWGFTTLMDGKGTFKDVVIMTAFAMTPLILMNIPLTVMSNVIVQEEGPLYNVLLVMSTIWAMGLLLIGNMVTHDFGLTKNVLSVGITVVGMGTILFVVLLFLSVVAQLVGFVSSVYTEVVFRV